MAIVVVLDGVPGSEVAAQQAGGPTNTVVLEPAFGAPAVPGGLEDRRHHSRGDTSPDEVEVSLKTVGLGSGNAIQFPSGEFLRIL